MKLVSEGMGDLFGDYNLYGGEPPHQKHSRTSRKAAASIRKHIGPTHKLILAYLKLHPGGATDERMADVLLLPQNTQRPRRIELTQMARVRDSGRTETTRSGRDAVIWIINGERP